MNASSWQIDAAARVEAAIDSRHHRLAFHRRSIPATMRTSYKRVRLPSSFEIETIEASGAGRRLARVRGGGRPLMVLPGMYARIDEKLFVDVTKLLAERTGRPVILVEDRFAPGTIALNGSSVPTLRSMGEEAAAIAATMNDRPEVIAMSAGAAAALAAPSGTFERAYLWSAAVDPEAVMRALDRHRLIAAYFQRLHRRCFSEAGVLAVPSRKLLATRLGSDRPLPPKDLPILAVHAEDDPVAPVSALVELGEGIDLHTVIVSSGGHLGFGNIAGDEVYLLPLAGA